MCVLTSISGRCILKQDESILFCRSLLEGAPKVPEKWKKIALTTLILAAAIIAGALTFPDSQIANATTLVESAKDPAVERARREVLMLV
jgi:hypothetical protein